MDLSWCHGCLLDSWIHFLEGFWVPSFFTRLPERESIKKTHPRDPITFQSPSENGNGSLNTVRLGPVIGHPNHHLRI